MRQGLWLLCMVLVCCIGFRSATTQKSFPEPIYPIPDPKSADSTRIRLGRLLFFDPVLSADSSISCASCHTPHNAFAHTDHELSHGIRDQIGKRNAPALFNLAWQRTFMWDGAVNHIEVQALAPISNPEEMGESLAHVLQKLNRSTFYKAHFFEAFGDSAATSARLLKSLAAFQLNLVSAGSKYDQVKAGRTAFSEQEQKGYVLFRQHCNHCHTEPLFSTYQYASNGLPIDSDLRDLGAFAITHQRGDSLQFKTPSLRNLSYSYPYMHDGRFTNLYQVLKHYTGSAHHYRHTFRHINKPISLDTRQQTELVSFLLTLNDSAFVHNPRFTFPTILLHKNEGNP